MRKNAALVTLRRLKNILLLTGLICFLGSSMSYGFEFDRNLFPLPNSLVPNVRFWLSVYTLYSTNHIIIHDSDNLSIIYEVIDLNEVFPDSGVSEKEKWNYADSVKNYYAGILRTLAETDSINPDTLIAKKRYVYNLFYPEISAKRFLKAAEKIRGQQGLREQFRRGLVRSGRYREHIRHVFTEYDLPLELAALAFVESLFHEKSYSKVGAAGIWQFTRRTGRRFLKINYAIDERFDPIKSTVAAARLLKENYEKLGSWPLAITAYNHGVHGMERAVKKVGSTDIGEIVQKYESRSFKFASRNFYAEFLAALEASTNYIIYFGEIDFDPEIQYVEYRIPRSEYLSQLLKRIDLPLETVQKFNLALRKSVLDSKRKIPRGYRLRIPFREDGNYGVALKYIIGHDKIKNFAAAQNGNRIKESYFSVSRNNKSYDQNSGSADQLFESRNSLAKDNKDNSKIGWAVVRPGETLGHFADWLNIKTSELRRINGLYFGEPIRLNQKIKLVFRNVSKEEFNKKRDAFKQSIEEEFFSRFDVSGLQIHRVRRGDNIWNLCQTKYGVPYWLVEKYNPDLDLQQLKAGQSLIIPVIVEREASSQ